MSNKNIAYKERLTEEQVIYYYGVYKFINGMRATPPNKPKGIWDPEKMTAKKFKPTEIAE